MTLFSRSFWWIKWRWDKKINIYFMCWGVESEILLNAVE